MKAIELTDDNFDEIIINAKTPVALVDFWAAWCGPCKMIAPLIDELANDFAEKVIVGKVNIDDNSKLSTKYQIKSIPTVLIFKNGKQVESLIGPRSKNYFVNAIERHLF